MNFTTIMEIVAGVLQFIVAGYALRLNRLFGMARVGWSLFSAFLLLALLNLIQSVAPVTFGAQSRIEVEVLYSIISLLLLIGMAHMETLLKERLSPENKERQLQADPKLEVKKKTEYPARAIEELEKKKPGDIKVVF